MSKILCAFVVTCGMHSCEVVRESKKLCRIAIAMAVSCVESRGVLVPYSQPPFCMHYLQSRDDLGMVIIYLDLVGTWKVEIQPWNLVIRLIYSGGYVLRGSTPLPTYLYLK